MTLNTIVYVTMTLVTKVRHLRGFKFKSGQKSTLKFLKLRPVFANITKCFHKLHTSATVSGSTVCAHVSVSHMYYVYLNFLMMMMIAFITVRSSLVPLIEGLCAQVYFRFEISMVCVHIFCFSLSEEKIC